MSPTPSTFLKSCFEYVTRRKARQAAAPEARTTPPPVPVAPGAVGQPAFRPSPLLDLPVAPAPAAARPMPAPVRVTSAPAARVTPAHAAVAFPKSLVERAQAIADLEQRIEAAAGNPRELGRLEAARVAAVDAFQRYEFLTLEEARALLPHAATNADKYHIAARINALS